MAAHEWWFKADGMTIGPVSSQRLRELALSGRIGPEAEVSVDNARWVSAAKVRGLLPPADPVTRPPTHPPVERPTTTNRPIPRMKAAADTVVTHSGILPHPQYPILRVRRRLLWSDVIAVYASSAESVGAFWFRQVPEVV